MSEGAINSSFFLNDPTRGRGGRNLIDLSFIDALAFFNGASLVVECDFALQTLNSAGGAGVAAEEEVGDLVGFPIFFAKAPPQSGALPDVESPFEGVTQPHPISLIFQVSAS